MKKKVAIADSDVVDLLLSHVLMRCSLGREFYELSEVHSWTSIVTSYRRKELEERRGKFAGRKREYYSDFARSWNLVRTCIRIWLYRYNSEAVIILPAGSWRSIPRVQGYLYILSDIFSRKQCLRKAAFKERITGWPVFRVTARQARYEAWINLRWISVSQGLPIKMDITEVVG